MEKSTQIPIEKRPFHIAFHAAFEQIQPDGKTKFLYYPGAYPARLSEYFVLNRKPTQITLAEIYNIVREFLLQKYNQKTVTIRFDSPVQDSDLKYTLQGWHETLDPKVIQIWAYRELAGEWSITALFS